MHPKATAASKTEWPEWAWTTDRNDLPTTLEWREGDYPPIGGYCELSRDGKHLTGGLVTHYFHVAGKLYVILRVNRLLEALKLVPGDSMIVRYDEELIFLVDEDDDPSYPVEVPPTFEERAAQFRDTGLTRDNGEKLNENEERNGGEENDLPF